MKRIATSLVLVPAIVWVVLAAPQWALLAAMAVIGVVALHEFDSIAGAQGIGRAGVPGMALGMALLLVPDQAVFPVVMLAAVIFMALALRVADLAGALSSAAAGLLGIVYIFGAWRCALGLRQINPHWLLVTLLVGWTGDTVALYIGRAFGRHKLAPRISPAKTWEGAIGSLLGGTLAAGIYAHFLIEPAPLWAVLALAAAANIAGQLGDLAESAFKRGAGLKDSGTLLPGHGGWLDRIDTCLFSIPVVYGVFKLVLQIN